MVSKCPGQDSRNLRVSVYKCPKCGSSKVARILYGYPIMTEKLECEINEGKYVLGGCMAEMRDPSWQCTECNTDIFKKE